MSLNRNTFFFFLLRLFLTICITKISSKLIGVIQVNRHGARSGNGHEDFSSKLYFGGVPKQLSINGMLQHELLGQWIADRYIRKNYQLLSENFEPNEFKMFSSSIQRTIFSAFGFIKGLYPSSKIKINFSGNNSSHIKKNYTNIGSSDLLTTISLPIFNYKQNLDINEIPINIIDSNNDNLFRSKPCRMKFDKIQNKTIQTNLTLKELIVEENKKNNHKDFFNFTTAEINRASLELQEKLPLVLKKKKISSKLKPEVDAFSIKFLRKTNSFLRFLQYHYGTNFINLSKETQLILNKIQVNKSYSVLLNDSIYQKLINSRLFDEFKSNLLNFKRNYEEENEKRLKFIVYSGHDGNILGILANLFDRKDSIVSEFNAEEIKYNLNQILL